MSEAKPLNKPWLVAVWPGMGNVAISAGYYLMAKLGMHLLAELSAPELFDVGHIEVKAGLIHPGHAPRNRFFAWNDPDGRHDVIVFIGEAQPPLGKYAFCRRIIDFARELGVERVFTFAAMATAMHPSHESRVFGAATDEESLAELRRLELEILDDGHIGGLNGVLLGVAAEHGFRGACVLGEMPHVFSQLPFPKASHAVLRAFATLAGIEVDLSELADQAKDMDNKLGELLDQMQEAFGREQTEEEPQAPLQEPTEEQRVGPEDRARIERLFERAQLDRAAAYELKRELDGHGVYREYEDRFLDLFKKPE
ncbi:MAG: PAC2 family protein [Isosphaeraceae bacterium]|nr:PAC2 family protein [Isosphaeraceae bacterium]